MNSQSIDLINPKQNIGMENWSIVNDDVKKIVDAFPGAAHPMGVLSSLTSALTAFNPNDVSLDYNRSKEEMYHTIVKVMGKIPVLIAWAFRKKNGFPD